MFGLCESREKHFIANVFKLLQYFYDAWFRNSPTTILVTLNWYIAGMQLAGIAKSVTKSFINPASTQKDCNWTKIKRKYAQKDPCY